MAHLLASDVPFAEALAEAIERLKCKGDPHSPNYDPDYEAVVRILAIGNARMKTVNAETQKIELDIHTEPVLVAIIPTGLKVLPNTGG